jgi:hypothetical protein
MGPSRERQPDVEARHVRSAAMSGGTTRDSTQPTTRWITAGQWVAGFAWMAPAPSDHLSLGLSAAIAAGILVIGNTAKALLRRRADSRRQALAD